MQNYKLKTKNFFLRKSALRRRQRGFVILFTVLISSIILAIAIGISNISLGEVLLSASAKEGNTSFYAANSGAECALYWDRIENAFDSSPPESASGEDVLCNDQLIPSLSFELELNNNTNCARVTVNKGVFIDGEGPFTRIESLGYNVPCDSIQGNPKAVQRAIRVTY